MDRARKKNIRRIIALVCIVAVVALLAAMPLIAAQSPEDDGPKASILSGSVATGSINTELIGGGTLAEEDAISISIPASVKIKEFLVSNGDAVTEGSPIATVDRVTLMTAISEVQETLEYLSEQIEDASGISSSESVTALAGGTVKILYAEKGDTVQSVMLEHGALAVLSLDGLMAVDIEADSDLPVGAAVTLSLSDGTAVIGKIAKNLAGEITVTVEDDDYPVGDTVLVSAEDGTGIGSGELYIYSPWNATAYAGTVSSVNVSVGDNLSAGKTLMVLGDVGHSATYRQLIVQRQEYEELMLELFKMYQTDTLISPADGVVSGIDKDSAQLLSGMGKGRISLLANSPNGSSETMYSNYMGIVTGISEEGWSLNLNPEAIMIDDYMSLSAMQPDTGLMTQPFLHTRTDIPIYTLSEGVWIQLETSRIKIGDILLFAADNTGSLVWSVLIPSSSQPNEPGEPTPPSDSGNPGDSTTPEGGTDTENPGFNVPTGGTFPSGGSWGGGGMMEQESAFELCALDMAEVATVTPQSTMTLDISVDELDIKALQLGMSAQVKIDALGGEKYTATITDIGNTGANNDGSSKYTVELSMPRAENMLSGMNATATIVLSTSEEILTIPANALSEESNQTLVYTGYDEESETLINPVVVKTGRSDGESVEILEGLSLGQTYYYAYYDTLEISYTPDFGGGRAFAN